MSCADEAQYAMSKSPPVHVALAVNAAEAAENLSLND